MKKFLLPLLALAILFFAWGCEQREKKLLDEYAGAVENQEESLDSTYIEYKALEDNTVIQGFLYHVKLLLHEELAEDLLIRIAAEKIEQAMDEGRYNVAECKVVYRDAAGKTRHVFQFRFTSKRRNAVVQVDRQAEPIDSDAIVNINRKTKYLVEELFQQPIGYTFASGELHGTSRAFRVILLDEMGKEERLNALRVFSYEKVREQKDSEKNGGSGEQLIEFTFESTQYGEELDMLTLRYDSEDMNELKVFQWEDNKGKYISDDEWIRLYYSPD